MRIVSATGRIDFRSCMMLVFEKLWIQGLFFVILWRSCVNVVVDDDIWRLSEYHSKVCKKSGKDVKERKRKRARKLLALK